MSIGSSQSKSESKSTTVIANASEVKAGGEVNVTSTKKDIDIIGSNVEGKDVTLNAKENLNITASKNTNITEQSSKSSSASVGASLELGKGPSYSISGSMSKGEVSANGTTYNESNVTTNKDLSFASGNDTNIKGGKLSGKKVTGNVGGDLNIESKQNSNIYKEKNKSVGASIGLGSNKAVSGSASVGKIDSNYNSVTDQSGIYAGKEGFDIRVEANTDLKGGIISSTADVDKNKLSTGTLTFEDIENTADYKADNNGISASEVDGTHKYSPSKGMTASGKAESTTKATVSEGTIEIRDKENHKQDINKLNCDTQNSLNKLGEIFDKTKVEERQELAGLFGEIAYKAVGDLAIKNGWQEGSAEKNALHALVGGIISELTKSGFLAGASGAMINEMIQDKLSDMFKNNPAMHQWASAFIGGVVAQVVAADAQVGAATASNGTKNNYLTHEQQKKYEEELAAIDKDDTLTPEQKDKAKEKVDFKYSVISVLQNREWYEKNKDKLQLTGKVGDLNEYEIFKEVVGVDKNGNNVELRADTKDWMIGYSRDLVEAVANIKPGDRIKFSDGSIYYVQPNGELYKEDSIGALMPYKEISLEDHNVISKRESLLGKDTVISDDHHEKAGQYVYDLIDNIMESTGGIKTTISAFSNNNNIVFVAELAAGIILVVHGSNELNYTFSNIKHDLVDNEKKEYNVLKDLLGNDRYDNFDSVAKVISLYGDLDKLVLASKTGRFNNINWEHLVRDDLEREKLKSTLEDLGLVMDIKTMNDLRGKDAEDK